MAHELLQSAAVAFVLVSDAFLWSHPYLKESAALIRKSEAPQPRSQGQGRGDFYDVCQMGKHTWFSLRGFLLTFDSVWALRGWSNARVTAERRGHLFYTAAKGQTFGLSRADANAIPEWKEVKYRQDGKHRLGYNPAAETNEISQEDLEAVRESGKRHHKAEGWFPFNRKGGDRAALSKL